MAGVEQNRYKTNNGCIKHLPQTGYKYKNTTFVNILLIYSHYKPGKPFLRGLFLLATPCSYIEIIGIECVLLSFLSKNFVSTNWRIYKGILASPTLLRREFRRLRGVRLFFLSSKVYRKIKIRDFTWKNGS